MFLCLFYNINNAYAYLYIGNWHFQNDGITALAYAIGCIAWTCQLFRHWVCQYLYIDPGHSPRFVFFILLVSVFHLYPVSYENNSARRIYKYRWLLASSRTGHNPLHEAFQSP